MSVKVWPPLTSTASDRFVVVPSPSCPQSFSTQHQAAPALVSAQPNWSPPTTSFDGGKPLTLVGTRRSVVVPSPSEPAKLLPQHQTSPLDSMPQLRWSWS